jgi:hypothetical protein
MPLVLHSITEALTHDLFRRGIDGLLQIRKSPGGIHAEIFQNDVKVVEGIEYVIVSGGAKNQYTRTFTRLATRVRLGDTILHGEKLPTVIRHALAPLCGVHYFKFTDYEQNEQTIQVTAFLLQKSLKYVEA